MRAVLPPERSTSSGEPRTLDFHYDRVLDGALFCSV
jgi:hypothetical protein